jgi:hypothetical protein
MTSARVRSNNLLKVDLEDGERTVPEDVTEVASRAAARLRQLSLDVSRPLHGFKRDLE